MNGTSEDAGFEPKQRVDWLGGNCPVQAGSTVRAISLRRAHLEEFDDHVSKS